MRWTGIAMLWLLACSGRSGPAIGDTTGLDPQPEACDPAAARAAAETLRDEGYLGRALIAAAAAHAECPAEETAALIEAVRAQLGLDRAPHTPTDEDIAEALSRYRLGVQLRAAGKHDEAVAALRESYALAPHPLTIVQIGRIYKDAGDLVQMRVAYARALALAEQTAGRPAEPALRKEHVGSPAAIAFSPDLRYLATADHHTVIIWDLATARQIQSLPGGQLGVLSLAFSPDGATLAVGTGVGELRLVDTTTWDAREFRDHSDAVTAIAFSPDGRRVVTGGHDERLAVHEVDTLSLVFGVYVGVSVRTVGYSDDGSTVAAAGGTIIQLRTAQGDFVRSIEVSNDSQREFAFSNDLSVAASARRGWPMRIWNTRTGELLREIDVEGLDATEVALSGDGDVLYVGLMNGAIERYSTTTGEALGSLGGHADSIIDMVLSPSGAVIASSASDTSVHVRNTDTGELIRDISRQRGAVVGVRFTPDAAALVSGDRLGTVHVWPLATSRSHAAYPVVNQILAMDIDPAGERVMVGGWRTDVVIIELATGTEVRRAPLDGGSAVAVRFAPDGKRFATASSADTFAVWSADGGAPLVRLPIASNEFAEISPSLALYAEAFHWRVSVRSAATGETVHELRAADSAYGMAFSPDEATLFATTGDGDVQLWDLATGTEQRRLHIDDVRERIEHVELSPDGSLLALSRADEVLTLYDLERDAVHASMTHDHDVNMAAFSPDGRTIAAACDDKTVRLWDVASGAPLAMLTATDDEWIAIAEDGRIDGSDTDDGGPSFLFWQVGDLQLPGFVGWQRAHADDLLGALMGRPE